ncbi:hypothetical protein DVS28_a0268 [Euzebya pacifica]|uniref:Uncharacterized protein n=1 Tax=Euzebya pacifica TaxID=1608957 RepID=A0A346XRX8_9ACTN|nr:hypothetical protein [Euzebya pacifica]AXV04975.1 hypothetical protein DVS28_a0268 [Euzebya pacifica]
MTRNENTYVEIDSDELAAWITVRTGLPLSMVEAVLDLKLEYMVAMGLVDGTGVELTHYDPADFGGNDDVVDHGLLAKDAEKFFGIPAEDAERVLDQELDYLDEAGLVTAEEETPQYGFEFLSQPYCTFNREERNAVASLYALLLREENLQRLGDALSVHGLTYDPSAGDTEVFVEFALLRDWWHRNPDETLRREFVIDAVRPPDAEALRHCSVLDFNTRFGVAGKVSTTFIQSPSRWSLPAMDQARRVDGGGPLDNETLMRACMVKWAFNIKPDLVVLARDRAICLEAKLESGLASYPTSAADKTVFSERGLDRVGQLDLQRFLFTDVLERDTTFALLSVKGDDHAGYRGLAWRPFVQRLDFDGMPKFFENWIHHLPDAGT